MACTDPRGTVGSIYKGEYYTLVHTTYETSGPCGFGEEDFLKFFSHDAPGAGPVWTPGARFAGFLGLLVSEKIFYVLPMTPPPWGGAHMDPRGTVCRFIKRTTMHSYTQNMKAFGLVVSE